MLNTKSQCLNDLSKGIKKYGYTGALISAAFALLMQRFTPISGRTGEILRLERWHCHHILYRDFPLDYSVEYQTSPGSLESRAIAFTHMTGCLCHVFRQSANRV
ncbi:hypothetical protein LAD77_01845 [Klebsiella pneumoniae]|nr:hypothetical protein [Klebsiella pneumoniae]